MSGGSACAPAPSTLYAVTTRMSSPLTRDASICHQSIGEPLMVNPFGSLPCDPTFDEIRAGLAAHGLDLDRLARSMRSEGRRADASGQIPEPLWQACEARAPNLNLLPRATGALAAQRTRLA